MPNLSQQKRMQMLQTIACLKDEHKDDDEMLDSLVDIERAIGEKKYGLVWETHEEEVDIQMQTHIPVFTEDKEREVAVAPGLPYNFLLEGDNLHSLYLLEKTHKGKIDVIYIDPPYNRGKRGSDDFIYDNNFIDEHDAFRHSKWLSFMKIRLIMARYLLSASGVIFISIDDTEQANLKLLCNDVFGEGNFVAQFVRETTQHFGRQTLNRYSNCDYVLCYAKRLIDVKLRKVLVEGIKNNLTDAPLYNASNNIHTLTFPKETVKFNINDGTYSETTSSDYKLLSPVTVEDKRNKNDFSLSFRSRWSNDTVQ